jgi:hypothetical protein
MVLPGRNGPCHCGSGKKYKKCCLQKDEEQDALARSIQNEVKEKAIQQEIGTKSEVSTALEKESEPITYEPEDENITRLWDDLNNFEYPEDLDKSLVTIETFIQNFPELAEQSDVIDEIFNVEVYLYDANRYNEYIDLLEKTEQVAPEFYKTKAEWFDLPRLRSAIAAGQKQKIDVLMVNFKSDPEKAVDHFSQAIDLLAWSGAEDQLHDIVYSTYKILANSEKIWDSGFLITWIYFDIYHSLAKSSLSVDECVDKAIHLVTDTYELHDPDDTFDRDLIKDEIQWIREDTFVWDFPSGKDKRVRFFNNLGWQFFKYLNTTVNLSKYLARFMQLQLFYFWMYYNDEKISKKTVYYITNDSITKYCKRIEGIASVGFLQAVHHFADFLFNHKVIDENTKNGIQTTCKNLYKNDLEKSSDCYPAAALITSFPDMKSNW